MARVVGIDPGTVSLDLCGLEDGDPFLTDSVPTAELADDPDGLLDAVARSGPLDGVVGPSGYGLPLRRLDELTQSDLRRAFLSRPGGSRGIPGLVRAVDRLRQAGCPVWILPGVVHLPTVPPHRKVNRIDLGTADKLCAAALGVADQARRLDRGFGETDFLLLEMGGAFTSALAVVGGAVVDGAGGSSGPPGVRSPGSLDGEVAVLLERVTKRHVFSGGALAVARDRRAIGRRTSDPEADDRVPADPGAWAGADGTAGVAWRHLMEGAEKACRSLLAAHDAPAEILLSGRHAREPSVLRWLGDRLADVAPVRRLRGPRSGTSTAAQGSALVADGLAGGSYGGLVESLGLRGASGTVFDRLYLEGAGEGAARWLGERVS